ncbi:sigma-70 family RNA polymerase sigma factor [Corallococcus llansteffanensis]|uniref:Sigma-70 family RNA polymerase sigma factor n=1 Tax=Corallococcus llansteffanensis TaxID=2316731 RepID=A0A3A8P1Y7_9BACT|nr:sigma-70 family RNA polymerase sigma factor [Corallococcus llansteffanensis]RKH49819.1 sigma-70 family RNA polymerase sigma factor [Corallococcus llansteffanensis]
MAQQGESGPQARRTAGWQLALVALALAIFSVNVLVPGVILGSVASALLGFLAAAVVLDRIGALSSSGVFEGTAQLSLILFCMALVVFAIIASWNGYRRLAGRTGPPPLFLRWPWGMVGLLLFLACQVTLPQGEQQSTLPVLPGALVLAFWSWTIISASLLMVRMSVWLVRTSWRISRASPFGAGILTLAALAATGLALVVGALGEELATRVQRVAAAQPSRCDSLSWECSRQALLAAHPPPTRAPVLAETDDGFGNAEVATFTTSGPAPEFNTRECLDKSFQQQEMMARARRIAQLLVGAGDAEDLVHSILLNICLRRKLPLEDFEQYFLRSVRNGSQKQFSRVAASCPLDGLPEPQCLLRPDDQYVEEESHHALRKALCSLKQEHQDVLRMRYFEELDEAEIARQLGLSHAAARKRVQRARDELRYQFLQQCQ